MRVMLVFLAVFEAILLLAGLTVVIIRRRRDSESGADTPRESPQTTFSPLGRAEMALSAWMPCPVARFLMLEPRMWWSLLRWIRRRPPVGESGFSYHRRSPLGALVLVVFFTTPVEVLLFELLIPVLWIRVALLVAAVYACFWVVALRASLIALPHGVTGAGVFLRYGVLAEQFIPFERITEVRLERHEGPKGSLGFAREGAGVEGGCADFVVGGHTDLTLALDGPLPVLFLRGDRPAHHVRVSADSPADMADAVLRGMAAAKAGADPDAQASGIDSSGSDADASNPR